MVVVHNFILREHFIVRGQQSSFQLYCRVSNFIVVLQLHVSPLSSEMGTTLLEWEQLYFPSTTTTTLSARPYSTVTDLARFLG